MASGLLKNAERLGAREDYQEQVTAWMEGMDARRLASLPTTNIGRVWFDESSAILRLREPEAVQTWDYGALPSRPRQVTTLPGRTVAVFSGMPVSVLAIPEGGWAVWDDDGGGILARLKLPAGFDLEAVTRTVGAVATTDGVRGLLHLAGTNGQPVLACWNLHTGERVGWTPIEAVPEALAISPDGGLVAIGATNGTVTVRDVESGVVVEERAFSRLPITALAFGSSLRRPRPHSRSPIAWTLAAGDTGGRVALRRAGDYSVEMERGAQYQVTQLLFSPDGTTLASGGRARVRLWDVATGRPLLDLKPGDFHTAIAFNADGTRLAVAIQSWNSLAPQVSVYALESGRGVATLRGLSGSVMRVAFSPGRRKVAALSMSWELGVWDLETGRLLHEFQPAHGVVADNAAMAFSPDERHLAYQSGTTAQLWDTETGALVREWKLPPGLVDALGYPSENELYSVRREIRQGTEWPNSEDPSHQYPRVCPLRNLMTGQVVATITNFHQKLVGSAVFADGRHFALEGFGVIDGQDGYGVIVVKATDGQVLWRTNGARVSDVSTVRTACNGSWLSYRPDGMNTRVVDVEHPQRTWNLDREAHALGRDGRWYVRANWRTANSWVGWSLMEAGRVVVNLGIYSEFDFLPAFDTTGDLLAWGTQAAELKVCDLPGLWGRLVAFGANTRRDGPSRDTADNR